MNTRGRVVFDRTCYRSIFKSGVSKDEYVEFQGRQVGQSASPGAFIEQLVDAISPVKNELVKMEAGSESETEVEERPASID